MRIKVRRDMDISPFGFAAQEQADYIITTDPARNALMSLAMLSADLRNADVEDWVYETVAALTPEQRHRNLLVFETLGPALFPTGRSPDFRAYLSALEAREAEQLRDQLLQRLARNGERTPADSRLLLADARLYIDRLSRLRPGQPLDEALALEAHALLNDPLALQ